MKVELTEELINKIDELTMEWENIAISLGFAYVQNEQPLDIFMKTQAAIDYYQGLLDGNGVQREKYMPKYVLERLKSEGYVQE